MSRPGVKARPTALLPGALVLICWAAAAMVFFRQPIFSGFTSITGDNGDTRLIIYLHEHWLQVLHGRASWRNPAFFFPTANTLGYSDTFLLDEVFYAPLRWVGLDEFRSYQLTLLLLSLVGYVGAYRLLGWILPDQRTICAGLAITFAFSNMLYVQAGHTQLYAVYWIPAILLLLLRAQAVPTVGPALLAGLAVGLLFLSTFYVAWFFTFTTLLWLIARWALWRPARGAHSFAPKATVTRYWKQLLAAAVGATVGGIPFLLIYLPNFGSSRSFAVVVDYAARPLDVLNTGAHNYWWGPLTRAVFGSSPRLGNGELGFGLTPVLLVALVGATVYLVRRYALNAGDRQVLGTALATAATCWAAVVLPMKVSGLSLWYFVWLLVPGARAVRAIDRIGVIAALLAPVVIAFVLADALRRLGGTPVLRRRILVGFAAVTLMMTFEQFNVGRNAGLDRVAELAALRAVPDPPARCRVFDLVGARSPPFLAYVPSIDAMLISQTITSRGIPLATINGFSGHFPAGYGEVADPGSTGYHAAVQSWISRHRMTSGVCSYDQARRQWKMVSAG